MFWQLRQTGTALTEEDIQSSAERPPDQTLEMPGDSPGGSGQTLVDPTNTESENAPLTDTADEGSVDKPEGTEQGETDTNVGGNPDDPEKTLDGDTGNDQPGENPEDVIINPDGQNGNDTDDPNASVSDPAGQDTDDPESDPEGQDADDPESDPAVQDTDDPDAPSEPIILRATSESGIEVTATMEEGTFPEEVEMFVTDVDRETAFEHALQTVEDGTGVVDAVAVDITFRNAEGRELEPAEGKKVEVNITLPEEQVLEGDEQSLLHVTDDGEVEEVEAAEVTAEEASFETEAFSMYIMTSTGKKEINEATRIRMRTDSDNSATNRYVVYVGEDLELSADNVAPNCSLYIGDNQVSAGKDKLNRLDEGVITTTDTGYEFTKHYKAVRPGTCEAVLNTGTENITFYIEVKNAIYLTTMIGTVPNNPETYNKLYKNPFNPTLSGNPYNYYLGDEIEFSVYVDADDTGHFTYETDNPAHNQLTPVGSERIETLGSDYPSNMRKVSMTYKVTGVGTGNPGNLVRYSNSSFSDNLYIRALDFVYVKTSLGLKNIDYINEWLSGMALPDSNGYIPNSISYPYVMYVGDTVEFVGYDKRDHFRHQSILVDRKMGPWSDREYEKIGNSDVDVFRVLEWTDPDLSKDEVQTATVKYEAIEPGYAEINFKDPETGAIRRTIYVEVLPESSGEENHADIEISDGGQYSFTVVTYDEATHTKTTTVKVYESYITNVNGCYLYTKTGDLIIPENATSPDRSFSTDDYYKNGNPGETQYELTSQYKVVNGVKIGSNKKYKVSDVDHAVFDVQMQLNPSYYFTITETEGGTVTESPRYPLSGGAEVINSALFNMSHQDVIDAANKCPNHSGLDFTITAEMALTELKADKNLIGRDLRAGEFLFEILDESGKRVATARNDVNGDILFDNLYFEYETPIGSPLRYTLREVIPDDPGDILYDTKTYTLLIDVEKKEIYGRIVMMAEISVENNEYTIFVNKIKYTLPETGGSGVMSYQLMGVGLIFAALLLYGIVRRRRKQE